MLESGTFAVTAELGPPRNADAAVVREKAKILKGFADAVNITDNQTAIVRMASVAAAVMLMEQGIEPVVQMTCRDRNRLAMQSDILGMAALGVKNMLCLTGDHQKFGDNPEAKGVWDLDAVSLTRMVKDMRDEKKMASGVEMEVPPQL
ncbi:MAG: methylenetetrahydrofolate reductase, partial [Actinomycetota bacterium]